MITPPRPPTPPNRPPRPGEPGHDPSKKHPLEGRWKIITVPEAVHPGTLLKAVLAHEGVSQKEIAELAGHSPAFINDVIHGRRNISIGLALALSRRFSTHRLYWIEKQVAYDFYRLARMTDELGVSR